MSAEKGVSFDEYNRNARLKPGLLAVAPIAVVVTTLGLKKYAAVSIASGLLVAASGTYLLARLTRYFGRRLQDSLWASRGGRDTTRLLRLRDQSSNPVERDQWRSALEQLTGLRLLTAEEESADPVLADQTIEAGVGQVLYLGQGNANYPVLHDENIEYGFMRNLWGIRSLGRAFAGVCVLGLILVLIASPQDISTGALLAGIIVDAAFLIGWLLIPSEERVRLASERYARQLFQAVVAESRAAPPAQRKDTQP